MESLQNQIQQASIEVLKKNHASPEDGLGAMLTAFVNTAAIVAEATGNEPKSFILSLLDQAKEQVKNQSK